MHRNLSAISALLLCASCASWLPAPNPMLAIDAEQPGPRAKCLMVFLPGGGDSAESFAQQGFVADVLASRYSIDTSEHNMPSAASVTTRPQPRAAPAQPPPERQRGR